MDYSQDHFDNYKDMLGEPRVAGVPLERDTLRRFAQAIMDADPTYYDEVYAQTTKFGGVVAPPLYPVHAFRLPAGTPDPLSALIEDHEADGTQGSMGTGFGLPDIDMPFRRLLNGGNEIEFFRCLRIGEKAVAHPRYVDASLKEGRSGKMLLVSIETRFTTEEDELLLINKQTLIWR